MKLLALVIAPGLAICHYIYFKDKINKEPVGSLVVCFLLGIISTIPALLLESFFGKPLHNLLGYGVPAIAAKAFGLIAVSEELSKYIMIRWYAYPKKSFDEPFDGIVYAIMTGMGFATFENIGYVLSNGMSTGIIRMFISVPAHAAFAVMMGYYLGLAKFYPNKKPYYLFLSILLPVLFHGSFDFFLLMNLTGWNILGALLSFFFAVRFSLKAIRTNQQLSADYIKQNFKNSL